MAPKTKVGVGISKKLQAELASVAVGFRPYETSEVPERFDGVSEVGVESERYFTVHLNNLTKRARALVIKHPNPLSVYDIGGISRAYYIAPENSASPTAEATEVRLYPKNGQFSVTSFESPPEERILGKTVAGKVVEVYRDPRVVEVDGKTFPNVNLVRVEGLSRGKVTLYRK